MQLIKFDSYYKLKRKLRGGKNVELQSNTSSVETAEDETLLSLTL